MLSPGLGIHWKRPVSWTHQNTNDFLNGQRTDIRIKRMQKSRTDRVRGPEGQGVRSPAAGGRCGARGVCRAFTARAAFEGASPHYRPAATQEAAFSRRSGRHHGSRRGGAGPAGVEQGLRSVPGAPVQVSTLGTIAVGRPPPSCGRSSRGPQPPPSSPGCSPWVSWRALLCFISHLPSLAAGGSERPASAEKVLQDTRLRRSPDVPQPGTWRPGGGAESRRRRTPGHAPLTSRRTPTSLGPSRRRRPSDPATRCACSPGPRAPGGWWKSEREGLREGPPRRAMTSGEAVRKAEMQSRNGKFWRRGHGRVALSVSPGQEARGKIRCSQVNRQKAPDLCLSRYWTLKKSSSSRWLSCSRLELSCCLAYSHCLQLVKRGWALPSGTNRPFPQVGGL